MARGFHSLDFSSRRRSSWLEEMRDLPLSHGLLYTASAFCHNGEPPLLDYGRDRSIYFGKESLMRSRIWVLALATLLVAVQLSAAEGGKKKRASAAKPKSVEELIVDLEGSDPDKQSEAAILLSMLGSKAKDAAPALRRAMKTASDGLTRLHAAFALAKVASSGTKEAVHVLTRVLRSKPMAVQGDIGLYRDYAALMLAALGPKARDSLPLLKKTAAAQDQGAVTRNEDRGECSREPFPGTPGADDR
jgi:hypothetical protein